MASRSPARTARAVFSSNGTRRSRSVVISSNFIGTGRGSEHVEAAVHDVQRVGDLLARSVGHRLSTDERGRRRGLPAAVVLDADVVLDIGLLERNRLGLR